MRANALPQAASSNGRILLACTFAFIGMLLGTLSFAGARLHDIKSKKTLPQSPVDGPSGWSVINSPHTTQQDLTDVTCATASDCWAVGFFNNSANFRQTLTEHWDGNSWQIIPSPNTSATQSNRLQSVSCVSASDCWAVGFTIFVSAGLHYQTLIEHWDGGTWSIAAPPLDKYQLNGVTCNSSSDCWAVGIGRAGDSTPSIIEHWNGSAWSIVTSPTTNSPELESVSCAGASDCWAVGTIYNDGTKTLTEHWDGSAWAIVSSPNSSPTEINVLHSVKCVSGSQCWAVGSSDYRVLIEQWDGAAWAIVSTPNASAYDNDLSDVTCSSASDCWAVGTYYNSDGWVKHRLFEHWNGTSWSLASSSTNIADSFLNGVACIASSQCWAVGNSYPAELVSEQWNGTSWSRVSAPNVEDGDGVDDGIQSITCPSVTDCWSVGQGIKHWNGVDWSLVHMPRTETTHYNFLEDVTCTSAANCWAVGYYVDYALENAHTRVDHWDGASWSIVDSPDAAGAPVNSLESVACLSATDCWAVGSHSDYLSSQTLIEHWDGSSWSIVPSPNPNPSGRNYLAGVACTSTSACWAVGGTDTGLNSESSSTLIARWDGTSWSLSGASNPGRFNDFNNVICNSGSDCWAVGNYSSSAGLSQTLVAHWNGTGWSIAMSPNIIDADNFLFDIACTSAANCWAVGSYLTQIDHKVYQTQIQHWNGNSWSTYPYSVNANMSNDQFRAVACASGTRCWAGGYFENDAEFYPSLLAQYIAPAPSIISVSRPNGGHFLIDGQTVPEVSVNIEASTDLTSYTFLGTTTSDSMGQFHFEDMDAGSFQRRFYRASFP